MTVPEHLLRCGAVRFGRFRLASGKTSDHCVDVKAATTDPTVLRPVADEMAAGATVTHASVVVDRGSGAQEALHALGVQLCALTSASRLLATPQAQAARGAPA